MEDKVSRHVACYEEFYNEKYSVILMTPDSDTAFTSDNADAANENTTPNIVTPSSNHEKRLIRCNAKALIVELHDPAFVPGIL